MEQTQAFHLVKKGSAESAFELRSLTLPELTNGQVLIEVEAFGLNYADVMARLGLYREAPPMPCVIGYEVVVCMDNDKIVRCRRTNLEARTISILEARRQCGICRNPSHRHDMHFAATVVRGSSSALGPRGTQRLLRQAQ